MALAWQAAVACWAADRVREEDEVDGGEGMMDGLVCFVDLGLVNWRNSEQKGNGEKNSTFSLQHKKRGLKKASFQASNSTEVAFWS